MNLLIQNLSEYLQEVSGLSFSSSTIEITDAPYFFSHQYELKQVVIGETRFTAVLLLKENEFKPAQFLKHLQKALKTPLNEIVVVSQSLPTYIRKRLIEKNIAFVIPKVQMYLPLLGMDLRSKTPKPKRTDLKQINPASQVVLISWLLGRIESPITPFRLAKKLGYSTMTMSRAIDDLELINAVTVNRVGKERQASFNDDRTTQWDNALAYLQNPISKTHRILESQLPNDLKQVLPAGISALSKWSDLNEPNTPEFAISKLTWKKWIKDGIEEIPVDDDGTCLIQVWKYDPLLLPVSNQVDPFSLALSLQDNPDERIEMALEEMMALLKNKGTHK